jgi:hypothetical protein
MDATRVFMCVSVMCKEFNANNKIKKRTVGGRGIRWTCGDEKGRILS